MVDKYTYSFSGRKNEFGEFVVICRKNGKLYPEGYYHTNDKQDAQQTMKAMEAHVSSIS